MDEFSRFSTEMRFSHDPISSLLEQWKKPYGNDEYDYDPYNDDMYEGQDIPDKIQDICDNLDIKIRS
ncbi:hypothetical protein Tco_0700701, partial [Tanacetum coccineum]